MKILIEQSVRLYVRLWARLFCGIWSRSMTQTARSMQKKSKRASVMPTRVMTEEGFHPFWKPSNFNPAIGITHLSSRHLDDLKAQQPAQRNIRVQDVPVEGIAPKSLRSILIQENARSEQYIDRISYEICVLRSLRDGLRCREIWINGADRYRNPDEDVPQDFEKKRESCYQDLSWPLDSSALIAGIL